MKKMTRLLALILALTMLSTVAVGAAATDTGAQGVYDIVCDSGYTLTPLTAAGGSIEAVDRLIGSETEQVYQDTAKFTLTFTGKTDVQYVVFLLSPGTTVPTKDSIRYIDQKADGASMSFTIYPDDITEPGKYGIYLSSSENAYEEIATFVVTEPPYMLGDANSDKTVSAGDASKILQYVAKLTTLTDAEKKAAMVSDDAEISAGDASLILQKVAKLITIFPIERP